MNDSPIISGVAPNQHYRWDYTIKNYGNSPALRTRGHARTYLMPGLHPDWETLKREIENLDFPPNSENTIFNGEESPDSGVAILPLSDQNFIDIQNGTILIVLGGRIEYFDGDGDRHNTTWCMIYIPDPVGTPHVSRWHSCPINPITD